MPNEADASRWTLSINHLPNRNAKKIKNSKPATRSIRTHVAVGRVGMIAVGAGCIEMETWFALHALHVAIVANEIAFAVNGTRVHVELIVDDALRRRFHQCVIVVRVRRLDSHRKQVAAFAILEHVDLAVRASDLRINAHNVIDFRVFWIEPQTGRTHAQHRTQLFAATNVKLIAIASVGHVALGESAHD